MAPVRLALICAAVKSAAAASLPEAGSGGSSGNAEGVCTRSMADDRHRLLDHVRACSDQSFMFACDSSNP